MTYKELVDYLLEVGENNIMINTALVGETYEVNNKMDITYPLFYLEQDMSVTVVNSSQQIEVAYWVLDRSQEGSIDRINTLSKTKQIAESIINYLRLNESDGLLTYSNEHSMVSLFEGNVDVVHGWRLQFTINLPANYNCDEYYGI